MLNKRINSRLRELLRIRENFLVIRYVRAIDHKICHFVRCGREVTGEEDGSTHSLSSLSITYTTHPQLPFCQVCQFVMSFCQLPNQHLPIAWLILKFNSATCCPELGNHAILSITACLSTTDSSIVKYFIISF